MIHPPRLQIGVLRDTASPSRLPENLRQVGHSVLELEELDAAANYEAVIVDIDKHLPEVVSALSARARAGQIYVHTHPRFGAEVLRPLYNAGSVVGAAFPLASHVWVSDALDELGQTVVELWIGEFGESTVVVPPARRALLMAALSQASFIHSARKDAQEMLDAALGASLGGEGLMEAAYVDSLPVDQPLSTPIELDEEVAAIEDPGMQRTFRALARRHAERQDDQDVEFWALRAE